MLVNRILIYCLARAAEQFDVRVHAYCFMSNHMHLVVSDPFAELPKFMHALDLAIAKAMNAELERRENLWRTGSYGLVALEDDEAILSAIVYTLMNPVAAGLVRCGHQWPGLRTKPRDLAGRQITAGSAGRFFGNSQAPGESKESTDSQADEDSEAPADGPADEQTARFAIVPPPLQGEMTPAELVEVVRLRIDEEEAICQAQIAAEGRRFLGRKRVLALSPNATASRPEPLGQLNPRVAANHRHLRIAAILGLKTFLEQYEEALDLYLACLQSGVEKAREVIFPAGTYLMRVRYGVQCQAPP